MKAAGRGTPRQFDKARARKLAMAVASRYRPRAGRMVGVFLNVCWFLKETPRLLSWRKKDKPSVYDARGLQQLAEAFFSSYCKRNGPSMPQTVPDVAVSIVMCLAYRHTEKACKRIAKEHQQAMSAENCVGALLERYLHSVLGAKGWNWCCGDFVRAVDFIRRDSNGQWVAVQIKNRDNSENSSSSAIRNGTMIKKWYRTSSRNGRTRWDKLPESMKDAGLSEEGFHAFVSLYLRANPKPAVE